MKTEVKVQGGLLSEELKLELEKAANSSPAHISLNS